MKPLSSLLLPSTSSPTLSSYALVGVIIRLLTCAHLDAWAKRVENVAVTGGKGEVADTFKCTFDSDLCGMEQDFRDNFDWLRHTGQTATFSTGPSCDPLLCQSGFYIYTESSRPRVAGEASRILTPLLHGDGGRCLLFYWNMEGTSIGTLRVLLQTLEGREFPVWSRSGNQSANWHYELVDIVPTPRFFKLVFEGTIGLNGGISYRGDIAVDNIEILTGECSEVVRNDCTFQQDICGWVNEPFLPGFPGHRRAWTRKWGSTYTPSTGPTATHRNLTNEYYVYVESSRTFQNDTARLMSGEMAGQVLGYCLQFFCHLFGADIGTLNVLTRADNADLASYRKVWSLTGSQGDQWLRQAIYIPSPGQNFRVIFEVVLTGGGQGDIAVDDVTVHAGPCDTR